MHAGQPAERRPADAGSAHRSRRLGPRSADQDPARLGAHPRAPVARLDVFHRARGKRQWPPHRMRPRQSCRRQLFDQCDGLGRGHSGGPQGLAEAGCVGWSYREGLPYFRRQKSWEGGAGPYRGGDGPLRVGTAHYDDPIIEACLAAGAALQLPATDDYNGAQPEGLGPMQQTIRNGRRCSAAEAYLRPALGRANLWVETGALAHRVVLERGHAVGVEYERGGEIRLARSAREVILAGGVINSPQLLMLSGIGDPARLAEHGIAVAAPLPGVGKNLQDHLSVLADYARAAPGPFVATMRLDRLLTALARSYCFGTGPASETPSGWTGFVKTRPELAVPDIQFLFRAVATRASPYLPPFKPAYDDGFRCGR